MSEDGLVAAEGGIYSGDETPPITKLTEVQGSS
jgi:hypothetical protein